jgi:hypothetical protein
MRPASKVDPMTVPAVRCSDCAYAWNSAAMAEGLRLLGSCPKCGGGLEFRSETADRDRRVVLAAPSTGTLAPHLVLGIPRR